MSRVSLTTTADGRQLLRWREGKKHRQLTLRESLRVAERKRAEIEDRLAAGIADASKITVAEVCRMYLRDRKPRVSDRTLFDYTDQIDRIVIPYLGDLRLDRLQAWHVDDWLAELAREGVGRESQRKALTRLRSALKFAIRRRMISLNVASEVDMPAPPPKRPIVVTPPIDVERQRAAAGEKGHHGAALIYSLGFYIGLRPSEIFGLTAAAFSGERITVDRRRALKLTSEAGRVKRESQLEQGTKTKTIREVDVPPIVREEIEAYIADHSLAGDDLLFPNVHGRPLTDDDYGNWVRDRFNKHRVNDRATPYSMRHSAATVLLHAHGVGKLAYIARQLGHSPTECLKTYQHVIDDLPDDLTLISVNKTIGNARRQVRRESTKLKAVG